MIGQRDNYVVATLGIERRDEHDTVTIVPDTSTQIEFWAEVKDDKSNRIDDAGKRRDVLMVELTCDSRDTDGITISHSLSIDGQSQRYQVVDFYQSDFKYQKTIIAKAIT